VLFLQKRDQGPADIAVTDECDLQIHSLRSHLSARRNRNTGRAFQRLNKNQGEGHVARDRTSKRRARLSLASRALIAHRNNSALQARRFHDQRSQPLRSLIRLRESFAYFRQHRVIIHAEASGRGDLVGDGSLMFTGASEFSALHRLPIVGGVEATAFYNSSFRLRRPTKTYPFDA